MAPASCHNRICGSTSVWGKVETVDLIEVKWPTTQKIEKFSQVKANQIITIREGGWDRFGIEATLGWIKDYVP